MKVLVVLIAIGALGTVNKEPVKVHSDYSFIMIVQNTEKSSGDLRRLTVAQL